MYYSEEEYPHDSEDLPSLFDLLDVIDWDILRVFDACRWDAFNERCAPVEPVESPCKHTTEWIKNLWCNDEYDWSDVTYISANPHTGNLPKMGFNSNIDNHVAEHVPAHSTEEFIDSSLHIVKPHDLTALVEQHDPPIVVHYIQPHNPFIGDVKLDVSTSLTDQSTIPISDPENGSRLAHLIENGYISEEYYQLAYLKNLDYIWENVKHPVFTEQKTITTADHGELLTPPFGHGELHHNRTTVVPFHTTWDTCLPDPIEVGASETFAWNQHDNKTTSTKSAGHHENKKSNLEEKLTALGYRTD